MFEKSISFLCAVFALLFVVGLGYASVAALRPPHALPKEAPLDQFSAHRAIAHAFACSMEPHPAGSRNNDHVAQYIFNTLKKMGVETEFMAKPAVNGHTIQWRQAVIGRIPGTANTGAIAFSAHYDSVPYGPGATDDMSGCIAMLEAARAFMNQPRMRNDLLFIFADAEEIGGYGAQGFCSHPLADNIGIINELDVRGVRGPALVYETSSGNGALISELREAAREGVLPVTNSLMFAIYEASPFGSDFTHFRTAGMKGYNLAYIDKFSWYHTANDSPAHINPDSIQHFGAHIMGISKHFGDADFGALNLRTSNDVYFNTLGFHVIQYPMWLGAPLAVLAMMTLFLVMALGFGMKRLTIGGYLKSLLLFPVAAALSALMATAGFAAVFGLENVIHLYAVKLTYIPEPRALYDGNLYCYVFGLAAIAITGALYWLAARRLRAVELHAAGLTWLCPVLAGLMFYLSGGSYLLTWPILFGALSLLILYSSGREGEPGAPLLLLATLFAAPALCLLPPAWEQMMWMINILGAPALAVLVVLLLLNLMPALVLLSRVRHTWLAWPVVALAALLLFALGISINKPSKDRPLMDSVVYAADLDAQQAFWFSEDLNVDEWTQQFFPSIVRGPIDDVLPWAKGGHYLRASAPVAPDLTGIHCERTRDEVIEGKRRVTLRLTTRDALFEVKIHQKQGPKITAVSVNSIPVDAGDSPLSLTFQIFPRDGYEISLEIPADAPGAQSEPLTFEAITAVYGFPNVSGIKPRPDYIVTENNIMRDGITLRSEHLYVKNTFGIPAERKQ